MSDDLKIPFRDETLNATYSVPGRVSQIQVNDELVEEILKDQEKHFEYLNQPASLEKAINHLKANRVYDSKKMPPTDTVQFCDDCMNIIPQEADPPKFPLCVENKELTELGTGVYFYFFFLKFIFVIMLFLFLGVSLTQTFLTYSYHNEVKGYCLSSIQPKIVIEEKHYVKTGVDSEGNNIFDYEPKMWDYCKTVVNGDALYKLNYQNINLYQEVVRQNSYELTVNEKGEEVKTGIWKYTRKIVVDGVKTKVKFINENPILNIELNNSTNYSILNFTCMFAMFLINGCYIVILNHLEYEAEYKVITPQDYTLMINDINTEDIVKSPELIRKEILEIGHHIPIEVNNTYDILDYYNLKSEFAQLKKKLRIMHSEGVVEKKFGMFGKLENKDAIVRELIRKDAMLNDWIDKLHNEEEKKKIVTNTVFAVFKDHAALEEYKNQFPSTTIQRIWLNIKLHVFGHCCVGHEERARLRKVLNLTISKAPEPSDIRWEHLELTTNQRTVKTLLIYLVVVIILGGSFIALLALNVWQKRLERAQKSLPKEKQNPIYGLILSIGFASIISTINFIVSKVMIGLTSFERNTSTSENMLSISIKLAVFNFLNTGPIPVMVFFANDGISIDILVKNALMTFIINSIVSPCVYLANPMWWVQHFMRKMFEKKLAQNPNVILEYTQGELNK